MLTEKPRQSSDLCIGSLCDDKPTKDMYKDEINQSLKISNILPFPTSSFLAFDIPSSFFPQSCPFWPSPSLPFLASPAVPKTRAQAFGLAELKACQLRNCLHG